MFLSHLRAGSPRPFHEPADASVETSGNYPHWPDDRTMTMPYQGQSIVQATVSSLEQSGQGSSTLNDSSLIRNGSVARTNAIAKLKRAASHREMRNKSPGPNLDDSTIASAEGHSAGANGHATGLDASWKPEGSSAGRDTDDGVKDPAFDSTLTRSPNPDARLASPHQFSSTLAVPLQRSRSRGEEGSKSPLPSLEQLRARILQERATAGLARSASTSAASAAARQYAMEKLLGGSSREGAVSPVSDTAEDQEEKIKRISVAKVERHMLRRSRTIGGLSAAAEAQRKAAFVQALDEGVPEDLRNARRSSRRFAHAPPGGEHGHHATGSQDVPDPGAAPMLDRNASQRQIVRTEMLRKLSTRRGARSPGNALDDIAASGEGHAQPAVTMTMLTCEPSDERNEATTPTGMSAGAQSNATLSPAANSRNAPPSISSSPAMQAHLLTIPQSYVPRSPSTHSSAAGAHEDERNRASALARFYGEEAFEYERLLEMGYSTDDAYERVAGARSGSFIEGSTAVSPRSAPDNWTDVFTTPSTPVPSSPMLARVKQQEVAAMDSPGTNVPVNVSPVNASHPNTATVRQDEWTSKHPSEASIPLGFDPSMVEDERRTNLAIDESRLSTSVLEGTNYPESVVGTSSASIASTQRTSDPAKSRPPLTLTVQPTAKQANLERIEDLLTPGFLSEVGNPLDFTSSPMRSPNTYNNLRGQGSGLDSGSESSKSDEEVDDGEEGDYLQHVDRMADRLERFTRKSKRPQRDAAVLGSSAAQAEAAAASDFARQPVQWNERKAPAGAEADSSTIKYQGAGPSSSAGTSPERITPTPPLSLVNHGPTTSAPTGLGPLKVPTAEDATSSAYSSNEKLTPFPGLLQPTISGEKGAPELRRKPSPLSNADAPAIVSYEQEARIGAEQASEVDLSAAEPKETFFSSLRRKASNAANRRAGGTNSPAPAPDGRPNSPNRKFGSFLTRKLSSKTMDGSNSAHKRDTSASNVNGTAMVQARNPSSGKANLQKNVTGKYQGTTADGDAIKPAANDISHSRNVSVSSTMTSNQVDDTSLALDAGHANQPPMLTAPAALAPATAAVLHRYSRMLTAPNESSDLPDIPGLSPQQLDDPPRRFIMSAPVLQVVTSSTVKDRFIFLFSDVIVLAKPFRPPPQEPDRHSMPTLAWTFAVKSILPLDEIKLSIPKNDRRQTSAHAPLMATFVQEFAEEPQIALTNLIAHSGLPNDPTTVAKLLHQTPELDRQQLSNYLFSAHDGGQVLRAFVYQEKFAGVSIESALRSLLLELRFPPRKEHLQELLIVFAQQWTETNRGLIKDTFSARLAVDLVIAIMSLNDALHAHGVATPGYFNRCNPALHKDDFVAAFRQLDEDMVLSDRTLLRIYGSVSADAVQQALSPNEETPRSTVRILAPGVPSRIVYGMQSDPIRIAIPRTDPGFVIRLYGQGLSFQPQILSFDKSHVQEFRVMSKSLGMHTIVFVKAGCNARNYQSFTRDVGEDFPLPRSINVSVQRAFMQHCFTLTLSGSRRFMISVEDEAKRKLWLRALKERIDARRRLPSSNKPTNPSTPSAMGSGTAHFLALHVLKDTLIQPEASVPWLQRSASTASPSSSSAASRLGLTSAAAAAGLARAPSDSRALLHPLHGIGAAAMGMGGTNNGAVSRQESISRHYYGIKGPGHSERELLAQQQQQDASVVGFGLHHSALERANRAALEPLTGEELILTVKQNSLLAVVIAHAQSQASKKAKESKQAYVE